MENPNDFYHFFTARDSEQSIEAVMQSLVTQTRQPKEIIVVDDGSTDKTPLILNEFKKQFPELIKVIRLESKGRDYSRIPTNWNLCLDPKYAYHWIGAGDNVYSKDYAEKIMNQLEKNPNLVIMSGVHHKDVEAPLGGGRFVNQKFFYKHYGKYLEILGYESEILYKAIIEGHDIGIFREAKLEHADDLGHSHGFKEFGMGMKSLGYYPPYVFMRCFLEFARNKEIGRKGSLQMLYHYLKFHPGKTGYYSQFDKKYRDGIAEHQKNIMIANLKAVRQALREDPRKLFQFRHYYKQNISQSI